MPLQIPEGYVNHHLTLQQPSAGLSARSTVAIAYKISGTYNSTDFARISNLLRDGIAPRYDNSWLMGPCFGISRISGVLVRWDDTGTEAGTHTTTQEAPPAVSVVVSKRTGRVGRSFQGRMYFPMSDEAQVDAGGIIQGAEVNAWQASMNALEIALEADTAVDVLALLHDVASPHANDPTQILDFVVRATVGTMRPRQRR